MSKAKPAWLQTMLFAALICLFPDVLGAPVRAANIGIDSNLRVNIPLRSMKALRDQNLVRQRFDYSCGAAALATLLAHGFGEPVTEKIILDELLEALPDDQLTSRRDEGFSLLDLRMVARGRDYDAEGFRLQPDDLPRLGGPVIVFIEPRGYKHFAVLKGIRGDRVYLADPSLGNVRMPAYRFLDMWLQDDGTGIIFVVEPREGTATDFTSRLRPEGMPQPEILTARELLMLGKPTRTAPIRVP